MCSSDLYRLYDLAASLAAAVAECGFGLPTQVFFIENDNRTDASVSGAPPVPFPSWVSLVTLHSIISTI